MAGRLGHRDAQRHRPADRPDGPRRQRRRRVRRGRSSMPGYGFSGKPTTTGWGPVHIADAWIVLMRRLGYTRYVAQGGDWGAQITDVMGARRRRSCSASTPTCRARSRPTSRRPHLQRLRDRAPGPDRPVGGRAARVRPAELPLHEGHRVRARDGESPADAVRARRLARRAGRLDARPRRLQPRGHREGLRREPGRQPHARRGPRQHHDDLGDEHRHLLGSPVLGEHAGLLRHQGRQGAGRGERLPARALPGAAELDGAGLPDLIYFNEVDRGNHFAAWQEPELFTQELRAAFRSLRSGTGS